MYFDRIIFVLSTDCYAHLVLADLKAEDVNKIKVIARKYVYIILDGANDYYMECNFSEERIKEIEKIFFDELEKNSINNLILNKMLGFKRILEEAPELDTTIFTIANIISRLYWLSTDDFVISIDDELIGAIIEIHDKKIPLTCNKKIDLSEAEDLWDESNSEWDTYIKEVIVNAYCSVSVSFDMMFNFQSSLDNLWDWKKYISHKHFMVLINAIETQAIHELWFVNPAAASLVNNVIAPFHIDL